MRILRGFDAPDLALVGAGEGALLVAEQLGMGQGFRQGAAVLRDEGPAPVLLAADPMAFTEGLDSVLALWRAAPRAWLGKAPERPMALALLGVQSGLQQHCENFL